MENKSRKPRTRIRRKNRGIKKLILFFILIFIIILMLKAIIPASVTFSRYVYKKVRSYYLSSKEFYFTSDKLSADGSYFEADNWSGLDEYRVDINMFSQKNNNEVAKIDIDYNIEYVFYVFRSDGTPYSDEEKNKMIEFSIKKNSGVIPATTNKDDFYFIVNTKQGADAIDLEDDDYVYVRITAKASKPYKETLYGDFKITVGNIGMKYSLEDYQFKPYVDVIVTNTLNYYIVDNAFTASGSGTAYNVGNNIVIEDYINLTDAEKSNCHSMLITMEIKDAYFNDLNFDTTSNLYIVAQEDTSGKSEIGTGNKDTKTYIKKIKFPIEAEESKVIRVYKENSSMDYTYPFNLTGLTEPVISVTSDFAG